MVPTLKPLVLLTTVAVAIVAVNNFRIDHLSTRRRQSASPEARAE